LGPSDDLSSDMTRVRRSDRLANRLLAGAVHPDDLGDGEAQVAHLISALRAPTAAGELADEHRMVAAIASAIPTAPHVTPGRSSMLSKVLTLKAAAAVFVLAGGATAAAAATGTLPDAAQNGVAKAATHIGVNLPTSANDHARNAKDNGKSGDTHGKSGDTHGPTADNHGAEVSHVAHTTDATGRDKGSEISTVARNGHGGGNKPETTETTSHVVTPNHGAASDGANDHGTTTADTHSNGHSSAGRAHAPDHP